MSARIYGTPGASAQVRATRLRQEELRFQHRRAARWVLPAALAWLCAAEIVDQVLPTVTAWILTAVVPYSILKRYYAPGAEVQRWAAGARAERRTAKRLQSLTRRGFALLYDLAVPGRRFNLDALILLPDGKGAVYVDTKSTRGGGQAGLRGDTFWLGKSSYPGTVERVLEEAMVAQRILGVPVQPVIAVDGASVPEGRLKHASGLQVVASRDLRSLLTSIPTQRDEQALDALNERARRRLPLYSDF